MTQLGLETLLRHGGRIDEAARLFPDAPTPWLDLSTGINPRRWEPPEALRPDAGALPLASDLRALEAAAADAFGTTAGRIAAVPGSDIAIRLLPALLEGAPICAAAPGYASHLEVAARRAPIYDLGAAAGGGTALLLANPSNPEGRLLTAPELLELAAAARKGGGWLVVDEAFADALEGASLLPHLAGDEPIIVLRSFGKFFGLAGLRLGFVVGPPAIVARVRRALGDWPVSAHAIALGAAAYRDKAWTAETRRRLVADAAALDSVLARHGLAGTGECPLFRLVRTPLAQGIFRRLARAGILVRPFEAEPDWLRFGLPPDARALERLDRALGAG